MSITTATIATIFLAFTAPMNAQVGYFEDCSQYLYDRPIEFERVAWMSGGFGSSLKFYNGREKTKINTKKIIGFVDNGKYYRYYKYATVNVLMKGAISVYGLVPTTMEIDLDNKALKFYLKLHEGGLPSYMSVGECGTIIPLNKKNLRKALVRDADILELFENKELHMFDAIMLFNINHDDGLGFIVNGTDKLHWDELAQVLFE